MASDRRPQASSGRLPEWGSVLAVVAHPDDESFGLGAVLGTFTSSGTQCAVLCFTQGEASTVHATAGEAATDLAEVRSQEFATAARHLGVSTAALLRYPDGGLGQVCGSHLVGEVTDEARGVHCDGLVVFDVSGVTGHPDHAAATAAALLAADGLDLPVLAWTIPVQVADQLNREFATAFTGHPPTAIDITVAVDRAQQLAAIRTHVSQAVPTSVLWRRLELLGNIEYLRWLRPPGPR